MKLHRTNERLTALALLTKTPASASRIAHLMGKSERNAHKILATMQERGLVERDRVKGLAGLRYSVTEAGRAMLAGKE